MTIDKFIKNPILKLCFEFSLDIIAFCDKLDENRKFTISRQLLRSGTAIGANAMEAQNAESRSDFIHKFKVAAKEAEETQYWLLLCHSSYQFAECALLLEKLNTIHKLICKIIATSKK